ncbi:MAG: hypothetical protein ABJR05_13480 [Balneola sp.]
MYINYIALVLFFSALTISSYSQEQISNQSQIEYKIHELTKNAVLEIESDENVLRKMQHLESYETKMKNIFDVNYQYLFTGKVWSVDFDNETEAFILRLASFNEQSDRSFFYNYRFNSIKSELSKQISELNRDDQVTFSFKFIDTVLRESEHFRGYPLEKNPDTGNYVYLLFITLQQIKVL